MNENRKLQFLGEIDQASKANGVHLSPKDLMSAPSYFSAIAEFEQQWDADIADQTPRIIDKVIEAVTQKQKNAFAMTSDESSMSVARILFLYNRWCRKNKISADNSITRSRWVAIIRAESWAIKSPQHLAKILDEALDPLWIETADCRIRGIAWLAFAGLTRDEIFYAPTKAFDLDRWFVRVKRNGSIAWIPLEKESIPCFRLLASVDSFVVNNRNYNSGSARVPRYRNDHIVRGVARVYNGQEANNVETAIFRAFVPWRDKSISVTYSSVYKSGFYYRASLSEEGKAYTSPSLTKRYARREDVRIPELERLLEQQVKDDDHGPSARVKTMRRKIYDEFVMWKRVADIQQE